MHLPAKWLVFSLIFFYMKKKTASGEDKLCSVLVKGDFQSFFSPHSSSQNILFFPQTCVDDKIDVYW